MLWAAPPLGLREAHGSLLLGRQRGEGGQQVTVVREHVAKGHVVVIDHGARFETLMTVGRDRRVDGGK